MKIIQILIFFLLKVFTLLKSAEELKEPDFTTSKSIEKLANLELEIVQKLIGIKENLEKNLITINCYLDDFEKLKNSIPKETNYCSEISKDPLKTLNLISRFTKILPAVENNLMKSYETQNEFLEMLKNFKDQNLLPNEKDFIEKVQSFICLYQIYDLKIEELYAGKLLDFNSGVGLNIGQIYEIEEIALKMKIYSTTIEFLEFVQKETKNVTKFENEEFWIIHQNVTVKLKEAYVAHDLNWTPKDDYTDMSLTRYFSKPLKEETKNRTRFINEIQLGNASDYTSITYSYQRLCRGDQLRSRKVTSKLKCYFHTKSHPFWILNPVKIEVLNEKPPILIFHEIITKKELEKIKGKAIFDLARAKIAVPPFKDRHRISSSSWINDEEDEEFKFIGERIERLVGLKVFGVNASEILQIGYYGNGGFYTSHYDSETNPDNLEEWEKPMGDRIVTFMIYLSDVASGGRTVFPLIGLSTDPIPGSALFWYNIKKDTLCDTLTLHAGCPVLYGEKWVANKWIRANEQMFIRKCPINQTELNYDLKSIRFELS